MIAVSLLIQFEGASDTAFAALLIVGVVSVVLGIGFVPKNVKNKLEQWLLPESTKVEKSKKYMKTESQLTEQNLIKVHVHEENEKQSVLRRFCAAIEKLFKHSPKKTGQETKPETPSAEPSPLEDGWTVERTQPNLPPPSKDDEESDPYDHIEHTQPFL